MLDFNWQNAPRADQGEVAGNPLGLQQPFSLKLSDVRAIELHEVHQYETYAGTLARVPPTPEGQLIAALRTAQRVFPEYDGPPVLLEPVFNSGRFPRPPGKPSYPIIWLPPVTTVAHFESDELVEIVDDARGRFPNYRGQGKAALQQMCVKRLRDTDCLDGKRLTTVSTLALMPPQAFTREA